MNNKVNKKQLETLLNFMVEHENLARGTLNNTSSEDRIVICSLWEEIRAKLNSLGPPTKSTGEWRRFWSLRKHRTRAKLVKKKNNIDKNEGGPSEEVQLRDVDEIIVAACGLEASVAGISNVRSYGVNNVIDLPNNSNDDDDDEMKQNQKAYEEQKYFNDELLNTVKDIKECITDFVEQSRKERDEERRQKSEEFEIRKMELELMKALINYRTIKE